MQLKQVTVIRGQPFEITDPPWTFEASSVPRCRRVSRLRVRRILFFFMDVRSLSLASPRDGSVPAGALCGYLEMRNPAAEGDTERSACLQADHRAGHRTGVDARRGAGPLRHADAV